jgi:hypothetical protein
MVVCIGAVVMALLVCSDNSAANTHETFMVSADAAFETFMASIESKTFDYLDRALAEAEAQAADIIESSELMFKRADEYRALAGRSLGVRIFPQLSNLTYSRVPLFEPWPTVFTSVDHVYVLCAGPVQCGDVTLRMSKVPNIKAKLTIFDGKEHDELLQRHVARLESGSEDEDDSTDWSWFNISIFLGRTAGNDTQYSSVSELFNQSHYMLASAGHYAMIADAKKQAYKRVLVLEADVSFRQPAPSEWQTDELDSLASFIQSDELRLLRLGYMNPGDLGVFDPAYGMVRTSTAGLCEYNCWCTLTRNTSHICSQEKVACDLRASDAYVVSDEFYHHFKFQEREDPVLYGSNLTQITHEGRQVIDSWMQKEIRNQLIVPGLTAQTQQTTKEIALMLGTGKETSGTYNAMSFDCLRDAHPERRRKTGHALSGHAFWMRTDSTCFSDLEIMTTRDTGKSLGFNKCSEVCLATKGCKSFAINGSCWPLASMAACSVTDDDSAALGCQVFNRILENDPGVLHKLKHVHPPLLYSVPGSGSTLVRLLLDHVLGYDSGSMYDDQALLSRLPGELSCELGMTVVKAHPQHFPFSKLFRLLTSSVAPQCIDGGITKFESAIVVVRDPARAAFAQYERSLIEAAQGSRDMSHDPPLDSGQRTPGLQLADFDAAGFSTFAHGFVGTLETSYESFAEVRSSNTSSLFVRFEDLVSSTTRAACLRKMVEYLTDDEILEQDLTGAFEHATQFKVDVGSVGELTFDHAWSRIEKLDRLQPRLASLRAQADQWLS